MNWVLIIMISGAINTIGFGTYIGCNDAKELVMSVNPLAKAFCVRKD